MIKAHQEIPYITVATGQKIDMLMEIRSYFSCIEKSIQYYAGYKRHGFDITSKNYEDLILNQAAFIMLQICSLNEHWKQIIKKELIDIINETSQKYNVDCEFLLKCFNLD